MNNIYSMVHRVPIWYYLLFGTVNTFLAIVTYEYLLPAALDGPGVIYSWLSAELALEIFIGSACIFCAGARFHNMTKGANVWK